MKPIDIKITKKQQAFFDASEFEVLFGGAAGGGKSYAQILDAYIFALKYPKSKQIIFRRTFPELEHSIIRVTKDIYRSDLARYNESKKSWVFVNGSIIDMGYIASDSDVYQFQSAEYDVIRFDECTNFTGFQYTYMLSRCRGSNGYPKQIKSSCNPSGVGLQFIKERFIDPAPPNTTFTAENGTTRRFIPSLVQDNKFLMAADPDYIKRLEALPEKERKALLLGVWDAFDGQYFSEFSRAVHVCEPFEIPSWWQRYRGIDYGLDCAACIWAAFDDMGNCFVYREYAEPNKVISVAAKEILDRSYNDDILVTFAPFDMWGRSRESGATQAELFAKNGLLFSEVRQSRVDGWLNLHEWLRVINGQTRLHIFNTCTGLIRCLPALIHDEKNPSDCSTEPHDITHLPDALRYLMAGRPQPGQMPVERTDYEELTEEEQLDSFLGYGR